MIKNKTSAFFHPRILLAFVLCASGVAIALFGLGAFNNAHAQGKTSARAAAADTSEADQFSAADKQGRFVYLIEFAEAGVLHRQPAGAKDKFSADAPGVQAQLAQVTAEQDAHIQAINRAVGRGVQPSHRFMVTHSGIAARMTPSEADVVRAQPGVVSVERERVYQMDTFLGPTLIGAPSIWNGTAVPGGMGNRGQGIVIAMLDSGVDPNHPSNANDASCGHGVGPNPNKLLSALDCASATGPGGLCNGASPVDTNGHGSHTAATAGGNTLNSSAVPPPAPPAPFTEISGVAPCANLRSYKVCPATTCPGADIQAGMNSVLLHGDPKVMNFSISGGNNPWTDNDRRKLDLVEAGIVVAASAGNTSATIPTTFGNVAHLGPWVMTVAASTRGGDAAGVLSATGPGTPPPGAQNIAATKGSGSPNGSTLTNTPIRHFTGQVSTAEGCTAGEDNAPADLAPFPANFFDGAIALIHRGTCPFTKKITNAFNAGAIAVIIRNNQAAALSMATPGQPNIPAYSIEQTPGNALVAFVDANPTTATATLQINPVPPDTLANFSLRGPSAVTSLTKPDITGPGVNIYAAAPLPTGYATISGTSMSSPHAAGSAALVRAVRPTWTPLEVKSALMMTAFEDGTKENQMTPWDADDVGSGRIDLTKAARAGLVMHETFANFLAANPATGGDPKTLNLPSMRNVNCSPNCTWTRTVRNTLTTPSNWTAVGSSITPGFNVTVSPSNFSFTGGLGETRTLTITASPTTNLTAAVAFGEVVLTETGAQSPAEHMTVAIRGEKFVERAVSRKTHGGAGDFDIDLPLTGAVGVENRQGPVAGSHTVVVTFTSPVTVGSVSSSAGSASHTISGNDVIISLTGVTDVQQLTVTINNASNGTTAANVGIPMKVLLGDVNGSSGVTASDIGQTKLATSPGTVNAGNFRTDVNAGGSINSTDVAIVKSRSGASLP